MTSQHTELRVVDTRRNTFAKEARDIQERALEGCTKVVRLGPLIFFCANQDAWMLDPNDRLARCLMREGQKLPVGILETKTQFTIEWNAAYTIADEVFTVAERGTGQVRRIVGYPTREIEAPMRN